MQVSGLEFSQLTPQLVDIYLTAMGYPDSMRKPRVSAWRRDMFFPGFKALIAIDDAGEDEDIVGVAYGFQGNPHCWWDKQLRRGLEESNGTVDLNDPLVTDYFEVAEIHVLPHVQKRGIGRALLTELLSGVNARHALLSTPEVENEKNQAFALYRSMGFTDVLRDFFYAGDERPFAILGRRLPLE